MQGTDFGIGGLITGGLWIIGILTVLLLGLGGHAVYQYFSSSDEESATLENLSAHCPEPTLKDSRTTECSLKVVLTFVDGKPVAYEVRN